MRKNMRRTITAIALTLFSPVGLHLSDTSTLLGATVQQGPEESVKLRVALGKSLIVNSPDRLKRVAISRPEVATAILISEQQVLIQGNQPGSVSLVFWDAQDRPRAFELSVVLELGPLRESLRQVIPEQNIQVTQSGSSVVLTGVVSSPEVAEQAAAVAATHGSKVVNLLGVPPENRETILLQVRFAEVDRRTLRELGVNILSTGAANTPGVIGTQQFAPVAGNVNLNGVIGAPVQGFSTEFRLTDVLNIFLFRPDLNLGATIRALEQRNLLEILAEPNLLTMNGKEASFLAGGEFPFPVVQGGTNFAVTIQFREFGVRLNFTPRILDDGLINLKVAPEVSSLDFSNAVTLSGFVIPALTSRKAETEVELKDGQSFAVAGLIDNRLIETASRIPLLGDIPFLGKLFRSRRLDQSNTELLVMVTPRLVKPLDPDQVPEGPAFPKPLLDPKAFDEDKKGSPSSGDEP